MGFDVGSAAQFLKGYLGEQEKRQKKDDKQKEAIKNAKSFENSIQWAEDNGLEISMTVDNITGQKKATFKPKVDPQIKHKQAMELQGLKQQQGMTQQLQKLQSQAAGQGRTLNTNPNLPIGRQAEVGRQLTNARNQQANSPTGKIIKIIQKDPTQSKALLKEFFDDYKKDSEFFKNQGVDIELIKRIFGVQ